MNIGTFSANTNRIYEESKNKNYNMNYGRINNSKYNSNENKFIPALITGGILAFALWKKVIKPAIRIVKNVMDVLETEREENSRVYRNDDSRILSGQVRRLTEAEAEAIRSDPKTIILSEDDWYVKS